MNAQVFSGFDPAAVFDQVDAGGSATLALVFCSPSQDIELLRRGLVERGLAVVGATTAGEIAGAEILEGAISVMLWDVDPDAFAVWSSGRSEAETVGAVSVRLGQAAVDRFARPVVFAFASGVATDGESVVRGVESGAGRPLPLYGGLAGDDFQMVETRVFTGDEVCTEGVVGLVLDGDRYDVSGLATNGWQPVGIAKEVTRAEGNVVYELDGTPILDVYADYLDLGDLLAGGAGIAMSLGVQYPLSLEREGADAVVRAPLLSDPESGGLIFAGAVAEGARVRFCVPPSLEVVDRAVVDAAALRDRTPDADAVLLVSCKARHQALGPIAEDEVEGFHGLWNVPMAGFFSYGEIGAGPSGRCDFHNETCSLVTVRERAGR